ncbi:hypothetical protein [Armatimonas sp.]|uniref:hypothetical protein n=1 Tax=Armatimonas sp. TaxID=1872638 RepID=UPI00286C61A4|nr:hypothetical protein [Armatimonas sp.]
MDETSRPYHLVIQPKHGKDGESLLRLWERKGHRLLWERHIEGLWADQKRSIAWSPDGRGLAVLNEGGDLLLWQEGSLPKKHALTMPQTFHKETIYLDYFWSPVLSPDKTRILFRGGASGDGDFDAGFLICWSRKTGRCQVLKDSVRKASWLSPTHIRYTQVEGLMPGERLTNHECWVPV